MMRKAELLAPAGSYETMIAAYNAGADAVYIGGKAFGARAYADNPDQDQLLEAVRYAHLHGKKLYLTVNTLLKENELGEKLYNFLRPLYEEGLDAVIVQDMGVLRFIREYFKELSVHASTQMTVTGEYSAKKLEELGVSRVVTARELSLEEIKAIHDTCSLEIESFVHGALCYCYSGQCLFSSLAGGRSGNRGRCAQPCRMPYRLYSGKKLLVSEQNGYLLSPKDLNTVGYLPQLLEAGVYSLKIEGRMKKPEYTAGVVSIYRKYLDRCLENEKDGYRVSEEDQKLLFDLFNRKGFTDGYYFRQNGKNMITMTKPSLRPENEEMNRFVRKKYLGRKLKENIKGKVRIFAGEPVIIEAVCGDAVIRGEGETAGKAVSRPLSEEDIRRCMEKIRDTDFIWESLTVETDGRSFYPVGQLNELRRQVLDGLKEAVCQRFYRRSAVEYRKADHAGKAEPERQRGEVLSVPVWYACAEMPEQLSCLLERKWITRIYLDSHIAEGRELEKMIERVKQSQKECFLVIPRIVRARAKAWMKGQTAFWEKAGLDGFMVSSMEGLCFLKENLRSPVIIGDHTLYAWTKEAEAEWKDWGLSALTAAAELNGKELKSRGLDGMELIVYGYLPMMVTAQCLHRSSAGCIRKREDLQLKDRKGNLFLVRNYCRECYNILYNSTPLSLADVFKQAVSCRPKAARLVFTVEGREETKKVLDYFEGVAAGQTVSGCPFDYTRGHWKRGVE